MVVEGGGFREFIASLLVLSEAHVSGTEGVMGGDEVGIDGNGRGQAGDCAGIIFAHQELIALGEFLARLAGSFEVERGNGAHRAVERASSALLTVQPPQFVGELFGGEDSDADWGTGTVGVGADVSEGRRRNAHDLSSGGAGE